MRGHNHNNQCYNNNRRNYHKYHPLISFKTASHILFVFLYQTSCMSNDLLYKRLTIRTVLYILFLLQKFIVMQSTLHTLLHTLIQKLEQSIAIIFSFGFNPIFFIFMYIFNQPSKISKFHHCKLVAKWLNLFANSFIYFYFFHVKLKNNLAI